MPNRSSDKSRLSEAKLVDATTGSRRSEIDPGGFSGRSLSNRYQVEEFIGMGGMAYVYRAKDLRIGRTVAIKILKPDLVYADRGMVDEFLDEAKATANLNHRNIIEVSDADQDEDGTTFLVMQYLNGKPLDEIIENEQPLTFERAADLFEQICEGVQQAHASGIIHRDLKPSNIMVMTDRRNEEVLKILDFGIAKAMTATAKVSREIGTVYYASPEQLSKGSGIDHRSDIYSLGVILYQLLTGAVPFDDDSVERIIYQKLHYTPPQLNSRRSEIPGPVEEVVGRAMAKEPAHRYQSATELARAFWRALSLETGVLAIECVDVLSRAALAGASIILNGKYAGQTDNRGHWRGTGLPPRQYLIELECPRYQNRRVNVRVESREEASLTLELQLEPKGDLIIACGEPGVPIELDGQKAGVTDETGRLFVQNIDSGVRRVRTADPRYMTAEAEVEVGIDEQAFLELNLTPRNVPWFRKPLVVGPILAGLALIAAMAYWLTPGNDQPSPEPSPESTPQIAQNSQLPAPEVSPVPRLDITPLPQVKASATQIQKLPSPTPTAPSVATTPVTTPSPTPAASLPTTPPAHSTPATTPPPATPVPSYGNSVIDRGQLALKNKQYDEAINIFKQFPRDPIALKSKGLAYLGLNQPQNAANAFEDALKLEPRNSDLINALGDVYYNMRKWDRALDLYNRLLPSQPGRLSLHYNVCRANFYKGEYNAAVNQCGALISKKPDFEGAYEMVDAAYQKLGGREWNTTAKEFYKSLRIRSDNNPLPIYYQGLAYIRLKQFADAEIHVKLLERLNSPKAQLLSAKLPGIRR
jgi:serine/threonine protein kinase